MRSSDEIFRREAGPTRAVLVRIFGVHNLPLVEDVIQDAFCRALDVWNAKGMPDDPRAWLIATAKNCALDVLRRQRTAQRFAPELGRLLESEWTVAPVVNEFFAADAIQDSQLRMMFSCCHPRLSQQAQVALILNILCGFTVEEIAGAFVEGRSAVEKRIARAKHVLRGSKKLFDTAAPADFADRLPAVHRALYLLFNEGYHGACAQTAVRAELCREAMRLTAILLQHGSGATPVSYALSSLMCLHAARLPTRVDATGRLIALADQDRSRWDAELIREGMMLLELSARGLETSEYHLEAAIASFHVLAPRAEDTNWKDIIALYDALLVIKPSAVVALNRAIAIAEHEGAARGLEEISAIAQRDRMASYPFYWAALGELERRCGHDAEAREHHRKAASLARNPMEREYLQARIAACHRQDGPSLAHDEDIWIGALDRPADRPGRPVDP
ncbi:RNA polymerase sigma factor [Bradyrhizobium sp. 2TAF24]|uniref:RNA polymerase sigma factor n=1 Tax=Bradyrhizobium sp. 2TAF24 TaxID=3233011 RepID=UPI003F8F5C6A